MTEPAFLNERAFTDAVVDLAKGYGWRVMHMRGNTQKLIQGHAGYPDLTLARDGVILFAELKMAEGQLTEEQRLWGMVLVPHYEVWRPQDWNQIIARLRRG